MLFEASGTLLLPADRPSTLMRLIWIREEQLRKVPQIECTLKSGGRVERVSLILSHLTGRRSNLPLCLSAVAIVSENRLGAK